MPVARIITTSPAETEELRRQLTAAGYSVKFAAPDEEFSDADIVIAAANVHVDYALQYASEVAAEADADVIVARGVVPGSVEQAPVTASLEPAKEMTPAAPPQRQDSAPPAAHLLAGTANELKSALADSRAGISETVATYRHRAGDAWQSFKHQRELAAEQKRLEREQRELQRAEQMRAMQERRREAEAQMAVERERLRAQRQAEHEKLRREQEEMRRAMEEERARIAAAASERLAQQQVAPVSPPVISRPLSRPPVTPARRPAARTRPAGSRNANRDGRLQRAAVTASVVALVVMLGFAAAINIHPGSPIPHSMVQNPVQERSPFGAASITPATSTTTATPVTPKPVAHTALPQRDATPPPKPPAAKPSPSRARRAAARNYVAEDEVVVHHYGAAAQKHPPAAQTRAGVRKFSDLD